jgi:hypothetical protein
MELTVKTTPTVDWLQIEEYTTLKKEKKSEYERKINLAKSLEYNSIT